MPKAKVPKHTPRGSKTPLELTKQGKTYLWIPLALICVVLGLLAIATLTRSYWALGYGHSIRADRQTWSGVVEYYDGERLEIKSLWYEWSGTLHLAPDNKPDLTVGRAYWISWMPYREGHRVIFYQDMTEKWSGFLEGE